MKAPRIFARIAGILFAALSLAPAALAQNVVPTASNELMNVAVYDALLRAGADENSARAAAKSVAVSSHNHDQLATKADLADLKADLAALELRLIWAGAGCAALLLLCIIGIWRKIAELAEKMTPPIPAQ